jgi:hypothetical protein
MFFGNVDIDPRNYTALEPNATISVLVVDVAMCAHLCKCLSARRVLILDLTWSRHVLTDWALVLGHGCRDYVHADNKTVNIRVNG